MPGMRARWKAICRLPALRGGAAGLSRDEQAIAEAGAGFTAPAALRQRIEAALPQPRRHASRRAVLRGFAMGSAVSALAATGLVAIVLRNDDGSASRRGGLGASAIAAGRPSHRRDFHRPAHG